MKKDFFCYGERGAIDWVAHGWLPRDNETTGLRDDETPKKHRHSQAFSVILSRAWLCVAVRGCARQCEAAWRQSGVAVFYRKRECRGIVLKRTAHGTLLFGIGR